MPLVLQTCPTVEDATLALRAAGTRYLSGGTLLVRQVNEGDVSIARLVRSTEPALREIEIAGERAVIGASVTMAAIARHADLGFLAKAAKTIGGPAVQSMATVGGNLFAPSPYGDFAVALTALEADIDLGERTQPIERFFESRAALPAGAIVRRVSFALPVQGSFRFLKVSRVKPKGLSVLCLAAVIEEESGRIARARVALGCMADHAVRAKAVEAALLGKPRTQEGIAEALAVAGEGTSPPTDAIASAWYRAQVLPVHLRRLLLA
jgi:CO/xanthine dehydrogenase FAD-binding subunit